MKKNWRNNLRIVATLAMLLVLVACNKGSQHAHDADTYTCPMHPTVLSDAPGKCPVCGMDLVRKARPGEEVAITEDMGKLIKSPNETVVASINTVKGDFKTMPVSIEAQGVVTYDSRNVYTIPARVGGRLENVFLKYAFQPVHKGQKVAEIYSPEMLTAQRELLYLVANDGANRDMIDAAKNKLSLLGATPAQVDALIKRGDVTSTFSIYCPYHGYVIRDDQPAPTVTTTAAASSMGGGMGGSSTASSSPSPTVPMNTSNAELLRAGNYVSTGQTLFKIVNTTALRVELDLPVARSGQVKLNDEVSLDLGNRNMVKAKVDFVQPFFTEGQEFVKVRLYVKNNGDLQIGQLVRATLQLQPVEALWIPREAVVDLGLESVVFVKDRTVFKPKAVTTGVRADGWISVTKGLSSSDEIAANGQYLVDSESFIKAK